MPIYTNCTLLLHNPVLQSTKINRRKKVTEDKNLKIITRENKLIYSRMYMYIYLCKIDW